MKNFVIPGGHPQVSNTHLARCVCRRAERHIAELKQVTPVDPEIIIYINRLSDYFFTLARKFAQTLGLQKLNGNLLENSKITCAVVLNIYFCKKKVMYWTLELASYLSDAPWPATKDELIDFSIRTGAPLEVVENLQSMEDEGDVYESIEEIWPISPQMKTIFGTKMNIKPQN